MHVFVKVAKQALEEYTRHGKILQPPDELSPEMKQKAGVFVCLKKNDELRGCIGTFIPCAENIFQEIVRNAIAASKDDPRFSPLGESELDEVEITVDVLSTPEKVSDVSELDPSKYGVIVAKGFRKGLLLPDLEGVSTVEEQLKITKMKAGIGLSEKDLEIFRFTVERYK